MWEEFPRYLSNLRADEGYNLLKKNVAGTLAKVPMIGNDLVDTLLRTKNSIKQFLIPACGLRIWESPTWGRLTATM